MERTGYEYKDWEYRELILGFIGSLTLADHLGDVSEDCFEVLKRLGLPESVLMVEWEDLGQALGKLGVKTLYGTELGE